nr:helix-turn-helix domain-containing protein [Chelativorans xinjiangense]
MLRPISNDRCALHSCSVCRDASPELRAELERLGRLRICRRGETVVGEEEDTPFVGNVVSGVLRTQKTLHDGRQQIVELLLPGDMFGRVFAHTSRVSIEAASNVTLCCFGRAGFEAVMARFPELEHRMLLSIMEELNAAQDWILLLGCQTVTERIASFLLILRRRALRPCAAAATPGAFPIIRVPICRRDMAAYLGTTVESISRTIQEMARRGVLRIIDPQNFEILDERRLSLLSGRDATEKPFEHVATRRASIA